VKCSVDRENLEYLFLNGNVFNDSCFTVTHELEQCNVNGINFLCTCSVMSYSCNVCLNSCQGNCLLVCDISKNQCHIYETSENPIFLSNDTYIISSLSNSSISNVTIIIYNATVLFNSSIIFINSSITLLSQSILSSSYSITLIQSNISFTSNSQIFQTDQCLNIFNSSIYLNLGLISNDDLLPKLSSNCTTISNTHLRGDSPQFNCDSFLPGSNNILVIQCQDDDLGHGTDVRILMGVLIGVAILVVIIISGIGYYLNKRYIAAIIVSFRTKIIMENL